MYFKNARITVIIFIVVFLLSLMIGCTSKSEDGSAGNGSDVATNGKSNVNDSKTPQKDEEIKEGIVSENPIELNWFCVGDMGGARLLDSDLEIYPEIAKRTNITLNFDSIPSADYGQKFSLLIASAEDLPDVMQDSNNGLDKYGPQGAFLDLTGLFEEHAPNVTALFDKYPRLKLEMMSPDGKIYGGAEVRPFPRNDPNPLIRLDWLKKVGKEIPETIDDWYSVLKAFREQDPNENGEQDEIPFSAFFGNYSVLSPFVRAYGVDFGFYPDDNGQIQYGYLNDRMKEALTFINKLYSEHLIDSEFLTNDQKLFDQKFGDNKVGSLNGWFFTSTINLNGMSDKIPGIEVVGTLPIKGPYGDQFAWNSNMVMGRFGLTKDNKYPVETVKLFDYLYSEEGVLLTTMGIEDKSYVFKDGVPVYTDFIFKNPEGLAAMNALRSLGCVPQGIPYLHNEPYRIGLYPEELREHAKETYDAYTKFSKDGLPSLKFTEAESKEIGEYMSEINTYVDESVIKFIIGEEPLDKYDDFVAQIEKLKIDRVLDIHQEAYDRFIGAGSN